MGNEARTIPGPPVTIHCPGCGRDEAPASTYQYGERANLLGLIPASPFTETNYVQCGQCGELFVSRVSIFELPRYGPDDLRALLRRRPSPIMIALVMSGVILIVIPGFGLVWNVIALVLSWRRGLHWTGIVSLIATFLSGLVTALSLAIQGIATFN